MIRASVIVPAYNAAGTIASTLEAIAGQDLEAPYEVIVVDDGSTDSTVEIVEQREVRLLRQRQRGPGQARNLGAEHARGEALAFTDADCIPSPGWLRAGIEALAAADLVQGAVHPDPRSPRRPFDRTLWVTREGGLYECASLFITHELFDRLGGFESWLDARIGKELAEDAWLGWRARRAGARSAFSARALVHHAVFRRRMLDYAAERARLVYFPAIVGRMPELREDFLYRRLFLSRRSATLDLAAVAAAVALAARSPAPLLLGVPYLASVARSAARWRTRAPYAAVGELLADATGLVALAAGTVRSRRAVL